MLPVKEKIRVDTRGKREATRNYIGQEQFTPPVQLISHVIARKKRVPRDSL